VRAIGGPSEIDGDPADSKRAYANASLADGLARAAAHLGQPAQRLPVDDLPHAIVAWGRENGLSQIVTAFAPVGPVADRLRLMADACAAAGIRFVAVRRDWDSRAFPHATRGFFQFKSHIPGLLA
jgi:deoxyribodipyrimidine photo-lyase